MGKKIKGRELLEACYVRRFKFENKTAFLSYIDSLKGKIEYRVTGFNFLPDGSIIAVIVSAYNNVPLIIPLELMIREP